jgi:uncharacterized membrane protein YqjE
MSLLQETAAALGPVRQAALRLARLLVEGLRLRARLAQMEALELALFWAAVAALGVLAAGLVSVAWLFANLWLVLYWWDTHRLWACGGVVLGNLALAAAVGAWLWWKVKHAPAPFGATLAELRQDLQAVAGHHE